MRGKRLRRLTATFALLLAASTGCGAGAGAGEGEGGSAEEGEPPEITSSAASATSVTTVGQKPALSTPAQRHMVRLDPAGHAPVLLMAVQRDSRSSPDPEGLHWYRSDDEGLTWRYYKPILADGVSGRELHLTADIVAVGSDLAIVISYDTTNTNFPSDSDDSRRKVYFQWWRFDGSEDWSGGTLRTVAAPPSGYAFHRAELARDSASRLWVIGWLRSPCSSTDGTTCTDTLKVWSSEDDGASFDARPDLFRSPKIAGGRILALGGRMMVLWGDYSYSNPARYVIRADGDPLDEWQGPVVAFPDSDSIYHGAALSAVSDGGDGMHLVYKDRVEKLYYRRFDGTKFGSRQLVDGNAYYSLQSAVTRRGSEVFVCVNHPVTPGQPQYEIRSFKLSSGFGTWKVIGTASDGVGYPAAPEVVGTEAPGIPCAWTSGGSPSTTWVGIRAELPSSTPTPTATPTPTPTATPSPTPTVTPTPTPTPTGNPALSALRGGWSGPLDSTLWTVSTTVTGDAASASGGVLTLTPAPANPKAAVYVKSAGVYRLDESSAHVNATQMVTNGSGVNCKFRVESPATRWSDSLGFWYERGVLYLFVVKAGISSDLGSLPYSATSHAWLRIRETDTTIYWETSPDGTTWTTRASTPTSAVTIDPGAVKLVFDAREFSTGNAAPGSAKFRALNE